MKSTSRALTAFLGLILVTGMFAFMGPHTSGAPQGPCEKRRDACLSSCAKQRQDCDKRSPGSTSCADAEKRCQASCQDTYKKCGGRP